MINDVKTMLWKEWKEILNFGGGAGKGKAGYLIFVAVFGIYLPLQFGRGWVKSPLTMIYWIWIPLFLVISVVADSFAGERERHTLETLLASRLSDNVILIGKIAAAVSYGLGLTIACMILGVLTLNVVYGRNGLILFSLRSTLAVLGMGFLTALLSAGAGTLVSLRAATVRQATQTLSVAVLLLWFLPIIGIQILSANAKLKLLNYLQRIGTTRIIMIVAVVFIILDVILISAAKARFQRARLILD